MIAGRTAQEYNTRKKKKGSFWEDRYHATAVDSESHLAKCMVYIGLNMVRAGAVSHPSEYKNSGYNEIQNPRKRYGIINRKKLLDYFFIQNENRFREEHSNWITKELTITTYPGIRIGVSQLLLAGNHLQLIFSSNWQAVHRNDP